MEKAFEQKLLIMVSADLRKVFKNENSIIENYYDAWLYLNQIIDTVADNASDWLLNELYTQRDYFENRYLVNKGLISFF